MTVLLLQDITNLAPRKPDWDVKRDVAEKLERLDRRTQKAIAELIRERLKKGQEDFVMNVNIGANISQNLDIDED
jgi:coiled-coil domain-containing protein 12